MWSCHIMHLKKTIKFGEFLYSHFNIEDGKNMQHFQNIMLYYFKKGKNATETQKRDLCGVWRRCCDWPNMSKVVCTVSWYYWHFGQIILCCGIILCSGRCLVAPLPSTHWKPIVGDNWHVQNIQSNSYWWKWKMCFLFYGKKRDFLANPTHSSIHKNIH